MKPRVITQDNTNNKVKPRVIQDNNDNKVKMRTRKEYQQYPRTREQVINNKYVFRQQMKFQVNLLAHDGDCGIYKKDDGNDINDDGYNNNTQDVKYYEEDDEEEDDD